MTTTYTVQFRNMSRILTGYATLEAAIESGMSHTFGGAFDVSLPSGAIVWVWEQR